MLFDEQRKFARMQIKLEDCLWIRKLPEEVRSGKERAGGLHDVWDSEIPRPLPWVTTLAGNVAPGRESRSDHTIFNVKLSEAARF